MTDEVAESTELANLNAENDERLRRIIQQGFPIPPGMFEQIRVLVYLETLLKHYEPPRRCRGRLRQQGVGPMMDQIEKAITQAKIVQGSGSIQPGDLDKIIQMRPHAK